VILKFLTDYWSIQTDRGVVRQSLTFEMAESEGLMALEDGSSQKNGQLAPLKKTYARLARSANSHLNSCALKR
jgi:hypothetical protein